MRCSCGHEFAPNAATFHDAQVIPQIQYVLLFSCPACLSTRSILMWEAAEVGIHFGEIEDEDHELLLLAAE